MTATGRSRTKSIGSQRTAISVCGTFIAMLFKHTYGFTNAQFTAKTGSTSPNSAKYYDSIVAQSGFTRIAAVDQAVTSYIIRFLAVSRG